MNPNMQFADDVRRLLRGFAGLESAAAAFEQVGQLQQQADEAQARLAGLTAEVEKAQETLARTQDATSAARAAAEDFTTAAQAKAEALLADAKTVALNMAAEARSDAEAVLQLAKEAKAAAQAEVAEAQAKRDALADECKALESRIEKARAQITKLLG